MTPEIVIYCCANFSAVSEEDVEKIVPEDQAVLRISRLPCSGRTDVLYLLRTIEAGAAMTMIVGCPDGQCQFVEGNRRARMRVGYANRLLAEAGLGDNRIQMFQIASGDEAAFAAALREVAATAQKMGPLYA
jgi:coenzyme F420-reducing hydrogenase delta subunit